jgi:hypothetical protein
MDGLKELCIQVIQDHKKIAKVHVTYPRTLGEPVVATQIGKVTGLLLKTTGTHEVYEFDAHELLKELTGDETGSTVTE